MAIVFECAGCGAELEMGDSYAGDFINCPDCGQRTYVPRSAARCDGCGRKREEEVPCEDCDALFCSRKCLRRHEKKKHRRGRRPSGRVCDWCDSDEPPVYRRQISVAGWVTFAVLVLLCWPLCFLGLFITEDVAHCNDCGRRL
jgi:hypothetical protein